MLSTNSVATAATVLSLIASSSAAFDINSRQNVALYWGQGANQAKLETFCTESAVDIIPIGFVNTFPAQSNGWPGTNFGNAGWPETVPAPGYNGVNNPANNRLLAQAPVVAGGITVCQSLGKKVLLSLGGAWTSASGVPKYDLKGAADGVAFANFLWGAFGPYKDSWIAAGNPRPLDGWVNGTIDGAGSGQDASHHIDIDGFDFDIELPNSDKAVGYIAMIARLRTLFATNPSKQYLITGAPQCPLLDANMNDMIHGAQFDILWVQFYNNPACGAGISSGLNPKFNLNSWTDKNMLGASKNAKLYVGLPGSTVTPTPTDYLTPTLANQLFAKIGQNTTFPQFGGAMIWEATTALNNAAAPKYWKSIKAALTAGVKNPPSSTSTTKTSTSTTKTSTTKTSTTKTSTTKTSTTTKASTTTTKSSTSTTKSSTSSSKTSTSTSKSSTSSSKSSTSTSKSSTSSSKSSTSTSKSSSTSAYPTSSPSSTITSTSITSTSTSSYPTTSPSSTDPTGYPTSSPTSSETSTSSSSSSESSSATSTTESSTASLTSSTAPTATGSCKPKALGCYTEAGAEVPHRTLNDASFPDFPGAGNPSAGQTVEECEASCTGYKYFGVEYGGECYCGNEILAPGALAADQGDCNMPCAGNPAEICGGGNRLNIYEYDNSGCSSTSTTATTTATSTSETSASTNDSSTSTTESSTSTTETTTATTETSSSTTDYPTSTESSTLTVDTSTSTTDYPTSTDSSTVTTETSTSVTTTESSTATTETSTSATDYPTTTDTTSATETSSSTTETTTESSTEYPTSTDYPTSTETSASTTDSSTSASESSTQEGTTSSSTSTYSTLPPYSNSTTTSGSSCSVHSTTTTTPIPTSTGGGEVTSTSSTYGPGSTSTSASGYTTSTVYTTKVITTTSCAPTVTDCPAGGYVTTVTIPLYTTVCPISHTTPAPTSLHAGLTTSTVYATKTSTITSCAAYVTDCTVGSVTTVTLPLYTTVCPVGAEVPYPTESPVSVSLPPFSLPSSIAEGTSSAEGEKTTTHTRISTYTSYTTLQFVQSTVTVAPVPVYPTQVKQVSSVPSGVTYTAIPTGGASGVVTASPYPTGPAPFTGAGVKISGSIGMIVAVFVAAIAFVL